MEIGDAGVYTVRRLLALLADILVGGGIVFLIVFAVSGAVPGANLVITDITPWSVFAFVGVRWIFEGLTGSTPGKLVFGLAVVRASGGSAGIARALVRTVLLPVDLALIGFLIAAFDPKKRRLGDFVAGTRVVNTRIGVLAPLLGLAIFAAGWFGFERLLGNAQAAEQLTAELAFTAGMWAQYLVTHGFKEPPNPTPGPTVAPTAVPTITPTAAPSSSATTPGPAPSPSFETGPTT